MKLVVLVGLALALVSYPAYQGWSEFKELKRQDYAWRCYQLLDLCSKLYPDNPTYCIELEEIKECEKTLFDR